MIINDREIIITRKNVKHINLRVYPNLKIKASVPMYMDSKVIKKMIFIKEEWIKNNLKKYESQNRLTVREYVSGEDHYFNGKRYILNVINSNNPRVEIIGNKNINMYVRKSSSVSNKEKLLYSFYKEKLDDKLRNIMPQLEELMGVKCSKYTIRKMKNKWGSCNSDKKTIIFNLDLAKKKDSEIKFVITHELAHLIEKKHNEHFKKIMDTYCPKWKDYNKSINELLNYNKID